MHSTPTDAQSKPRGSVVTASTIVLTIVACGYSALAGWRAHSDPAPGYADDYALVVDGYWYLEPARAALQSRSPSVDDEYRQPVLTAAHILSLLAFGDTPLGARATNIFAGVIALVIVGLVLRAFFGSPIALAVTALFALEPTFLAHVRTNTVYIPAAALITFIVAVVSLDLVVLGAAFAIGLSMFGVAASVVTFSSVDTTGALAAALSIALAGWTLRRSRQQRDGALDAPIVGIAIAIAGAAFLKSIVLFVIPGLVFEMVQRRPTELTKRQTIALAGTLVLLIPGLVGTANVLVPDFVQRVWWYFGATEAAPIANWWTVERRWHLVGAVPVVALGSFAVLALSLVRNAVHPLTRIALVSSWPFLAAGMFFEYIPLRYAIAFLPVLVLSLGEPVAAIARVSVPRLAYDRAVRTAGFVVVGVAGIGLLAGIPQAASTSSLSLPLLTTSTGIAVGLVFAATALRRMNSRHLARIAALIVVPFVAFSFMVRTKEVVADTGTSLADARDTLEVAIGTSQTKLFGVHAHALVQGTDLKAEKAFQLEYGAGKLRHAMRSRRITHLVFESRAAADRVRPLFESDGLVLYRILSLPVAGSELEIFRVEDPSDRAPLRTPFERATRSLRSDRIDEAIDLAHTIVDMYPDHTPTWILLGRALRESGDPDAAFAAFGMAADADPTYVDALVERANLFFGIGEIDAGLEELERAAATGLRPHLATELRRLRAQRTDAPPSRETGS